MIKGKKEEKQTKKASKSNSKKRGNLWLMHLKIS